MATNMRKSDHKCTSYEKNDNEKSKGGFSKTFVTNYNEILNNADLTTGPICNGYLEYSERESSADHITSLTFEFFFNFKSLLCIFMHI